MGTQKVIVVTSMNTTPENEIANRLAEFGDGWHITSATTTIAPVGSMNINEPGKVFLGVAVHMYYATTLILEKFIA